MDHWTVLLHPCDSPPLFLQHFTLILNALFDDNLAYSRSILTILCYYCPPQTQCGPRSNFPLESGGVYWLRWQEC